MRIQLPREAIIMQVRGMLRFQMLLLELVLKIVCNGLTKSVRSLQGNPTGDFFGGGVSFDDEETTAEIVKIG